MQVGGAGDPAGVSERVSLPGSCLASAESVLGRARALIPRGGFPSTVPSDLRSAQRLLQDVRRAASEAVHRAADGTGDAKVPVLGLALLVDEAWAVLDLLRDSVPTAPRSSAMSWISMLRSARDVEDLLDRTGAVVHGLGFSRVGVSFIESGSWTMRRAYMERDPALASRVCGLSASDPRRLTSDSFEGRVAAGRRGMVVADVHRQQERTHGAIVRELGITSVLMLPLVIGESAVGLLHADVSDLSGRALAGQARTLGDFASVYSVVLESVRLNEAIRQFQAALPFRWPVATRTAQDSEVFSELTPRETEVLELLAQGMSNDEIAGRLVLSTGTVKSHVKHVLRKLGVGNRAAAAARYCRRQG
jgi:DNA-binding CsgD family transcriptional regulator